MPKPFYNRLKSYYLKVAAVLKGEAEAGSVFPNPSDIGLSRELIYVNFLKQHLPSKCNVFLGGFLFGENGDESKQLDVIISTDTAPKFDFHNSHGEGKSFGPVDGCLGVASIKSNLTKNELIDSLDGIASIPNTKSIEGRVPTFISINNYENWPYKIIYASKGLKGVTTLKHINNYYSNNTDIPLGRRPDIIHVVGSFVIFKVIPGMDIESIKKEIKKDIKLGDYYISIIEPDLQALTWTIHSLQGNAVASNQIFFYYHEILNAINKQWNT